VGADKVKKRLVSIFMMVVFLITIIPSGVFAAQNVTLNNIESKRPGDNVTISGTSTMDEVTLTVKRPNNTVLYVQPLNEGNINHMFTLPVDAQLGTYKVMVGRGSDFDTKTFEVKNETIIKSDIVNVTDIADISVNYGTEFDQIELPSQIEVTLDDKTTKELQVVWNKEGYKSNVAGVYTLSGELTLKDNVTNTKTLKAELKVTVEKEIVEKLNIDTVPISQDITVEYGTKVDEIALPDKIEVILEDDTTKKLQVVWNTEKYNGNVAGDYMLEGTLSLIDNVENNNNLKAQIKVTVEKEIVQKLSIKKVPVSQDTSVKYGTKVDGIELPKEIKVTLDDGTTRNLQVIWNTEKYNGNVAGAYILEGTLTLIDNVENNYKLKGEIKVTVEKEIVEITLNNIESKRPGDDVTISGTSSIDEVTLTVICPDKTPLYVQVLNVNENTFNDMFTLPVNADSGTYKVMVGVGKDFVTKTFEVVKEAVIQKNISSVKPIENMTVAYGTEIELPEEIEVTLDG